jgi:hypothetical protein
MYSTKIDHKKVDRTMEAAALKLEKEITNMASENKHVRQERGQESYLETDETGKYKNEEMEHSGVYRNTSKTKKKFTCFNPVVANKAKETKFAYMAKSYTTSINNAPEPGSPPRSLFNTEFLAKLKTDSVEPRQKVNKPAPVVPMQPVAPISQSTPAPPANINYAN